jgi:hypothetical protein
VSELDGNEGVALALSDAVREAHADKVVLGTRGLDSVSRCAHASARVPVSVPSHLACRMGYVFFAGPTSPAACSMHASLAGKVCLRLGSTGMVPSVAAPPGRCPMHGRRVQRRLSQLVCRPRRPRRRTLLGALGRGSVSDYTRTHVPCSVEVVGKGGAVRQIP